MAEESIEVQTQAVLARIMAQSGGTAPPIPPQSAQSGNGGDNDPMEERVARLESFAQDARDRLTRIETRLEQTPTKSDLSNEMNGMIKWVVGSAAVLGATGITVMTFVLNNASPKLAAPAPAQPIVITIPAPTVAPSPGQGK